MSEAVYGLVAQLATDLAGRIVALTDDICSLEKWILVLGRWRAPSLLTVPGGPS
jgi:hypothetical protein